MISTIHADLFKPFSTLRRLDLSHTGIIDCSRFASHMHTALTHLSFDSNDFLPTVAFARNYRHLQDCSMVDSRKSHRAYHDVQRQLQAVIEHSGDEAADCLITLEFLERRVHVTNPPPRPGLDDPVESDGWSTEY
jgi:hypothetical protein